MVGGPDCSQSGSRSDKRSSQHAGESVSCGCATLVASNLRKSSFCDHPGECGRRLVIDCRASRSRPNLLNSTKQPRQFIPPEPHLNARRESNSIASQDW
jgi:hypothetical protein